MVTELDWKIGEACGSVETFKSLGQKIIATYLFNVDMIIQLIKSPLNKSAILFSLTLSRKENN